MSWSSTHAQPSADQKDCVVYAPASTNAAKEAFVTSVVSIPVAAREGHLVGRLLAVHALEDPDGGGSWATSASMSAASEPIWNVPAGTHTWATPVASVRVAPAVGDAVGAGVAVAAGADEVAGPEQAAARTATETAMEIVAMARTRTWEPPSPVRCRATGHPRRRFGRTSRPKTSMNSAWLRPTLWMWTSS